MESSLLVILQLLSPRVAAGMAASNNGDFTNAFYTAIALAVVGFILNIAYVQLKKSHNVSIAK